MTAYRVILARSGKAQCIELDAASLEDACQWARKAQMAQPERDRCEVWSVEKVMEYKGKPVLVKEQTA